MVTETLQYYLFKLFKKISEKFANFYLTLTHWEKNLIILCNYGIMRSVSECFQLQAEGLPVHRYKKDAV